MSTQVIAILAGSTIGVLGFLSLLAYFLVGQKQQAQEESIAAAIGNSGPLDASAISKFIERLPPEQLLPAFEMALGSQKDQARSLIKKIKENVDVNKIHAAKLRSKGQRALITAGFLIAIGAGGIVYGIASPEAVAPRVSPTPTSPSPTLPPTSPTPASPHPTQPTTPPVPTTPASPSPAAGCRDAIPPGATSTQEVEASGGSGNMGIAVFNIAANCSVTATLTADITWSSDDRGAAGDFAYSWDQQGTRSLPSSNIELPTGAGRGMPKKVRNEKRVTADGSGQVVIEVRIEACETRGNPHDRSRICTMKGRVSIR